MILISKGDDANERSKIYLFQITRC